MSFVAHVHAFLLGTYLGIQLLGHRICIWSALVDTVKLFSKVAFQEDLYFPQDLLPYCFLPLDSSLESRSHHVSGGQV